MNLVSCQPLCSWREAQALALRPLGSGPRLLGHPPVGTAGGCLLFWGCPALLGFSSPSAQDAAVCGQTGMQGGRCCNVWRRTHRLLCVLRGDGSNAAGIRWHFAGDAHGGPQSQKRKGAVTVLTPLC